MSQRNKTIAIITTKLHRPPVAADIICREKLHARLDEGRQFPLSLIIAPAGYGKSTAISHWLQSSKYPSAWLSLDETDSDLRVFLVYFVAALRNVVPECCRNTLRQLQTDELKDPKALAHILCNDLERSGKSLVLVLDDYHRLHNAAIHEFLDHLLEHPTRNLHLAIIARWDPPLSLAAMRGRQMLTEVRLQDLQFTEEETAVFLQRTLNRSVGFPACKLLHERAEGWPVALRLASLALQHHTDIDKYIQSFGSISRPLHEYLVEEMLSQQSAESRSCLCRMSILDRFCAPLAQSLCGMHCGEEKCAFHSGGFDQAFLSMGLLAIPMDDRQEWYRFHHLFQELLQQFLEDSLAPSGIAELHSRAAAWFEEHGLLDEAIRHALKGSDPTEAGRIIARHGNEILNQEQWHRFDLWLSWLPSGAAEINPELLMLKAWLMQNRGRYAKSFKLIDSVEELIAASSLDSISSKRIQGGVSALRSLQRCMECQGELAVKCAEQALVDLPPECRIQRGEAIIYLAAAHQMTGNLGRARKVVYDALAQDSIPRNSSYHSRLLASFCFVNWMAADLPALKREASQLVEMSDKHDLFESGSVGRYFVGIAEYQQNELSAAEKSLLPVATDCFSPNLEYFAQSAFALSCVYEAQGRADKAKELVDSVCEQMLRIPNTAVLQIVQAFQAELALRQGRGSESLAWAQQFDPEPFEPMYRFHSPQITLAKVLVLKGDTQNHKRAVDLLDRLERFLSEIHNQRFLIEVFALQSLLYKTQGDESKARAVLSRAVSLAQPGGFIRLFVDLGPRLAELLVHLDSDAESRGYISRILTAFSSGRETKLDQSPENLQLSLRSLTNRELEILGMLGKRFSNKEIGDQLHISPATVKRHAENIYSKLGVRGRRDAVAKAKSIGIFSTA